MVVHTSYSNTETKAFLEAAGDARDTKAGIYL